MKKRIIQSLLVIVFLLYLGFFKQDKPIEAIIYEADSPFAGVSDFVPILDTLPVIVEENLVETVGEEEPIPEIETTELYLSYLNMGYTSEQFYSDLDLFAGIVVAEAGNQSELGKRLVIDVVLNRIDSDRWRDDYTIWEVIAHPYQFETYSTGAYMRVNIDESISVLIEEEIINRTNYEVTYFRTGYYFDGLPQILVEGDHYFSGDYN